VSVAMERTSEIETRPWFGADRPTWSLLIVDDDKPFAARAGEGDGNRADLWSKPGRT